MKETSSETLQGVCKILYDQLTDLLANSGLDYSEKMDILQTICTVDEMVTEDLKMILKHKRNK